MQVVGPHAGPQEAAQTQHLQIARARHHHRQRDHNNTQAILRAQLGVVQVSKVFRPEQLVNKNYKLFFDKFQKFLGIERYLFHMNKINKK